MGGHRHETLFKSTVLNISGPFLAEQPSLSPAALLKVKENIYKIMFLLYKYIEIQLYTKACLFMTSSKFRCA